MACGLPGLISVNDGAIDHIRDGENGFLLHEPTNAEALRDSLNQAFRLSTDQRDAMGLRARETMLPLTWDAHVAKWMQLIV
jgi:glycosyltransferase involved in cell wall biosynthesis